MRGFEAAYRITFFASLGALALAAFLPGWPAKWGGRGSTQSPQEAIREDGLPTHFMPTAQERETSARRSLLVIVGP